MHGLTMRTTTLTAAISALAIAGCGGSGDESRPGAASAATTTATAATGTVPEMKTGAPTGSTSATLADSRLQAGKVIDGDIEERLASLKGVPVVVKQWASWCPQCDAEFPYFQQLATRYRSRVAFVGLNARDDRADAEAYSADNDLKFPSIYDKDGSQSSAIGAGRSWPTTVIYDSAGNRAVVKPGAFASVEELDDYIRRYALPG